MELLECLYRTTIYIYNGCYGNLKLLLMQLLAHLDIMYMFYLWNFRKSLYKF